MPKSIAHCEQKTWEMIVNKRTQKLSRHTAKGNKNKYDKMNWSENVIHVNFV